VDKALVIAVISGVVALVSGLMSYRASTRAVTVTAHETDLKRLQAIIDEQAKYIDRLNLRVNEAEAELNRLRRMERG
jgi:hypothetical protein